MIPSVLFYTSTYVRNAFCINGYSLYLWAFLSIQYWQMRIAIKHFDCTYLDKHGQQRIWVTPAKDAFHVRLTFEEMVGDGRIISIKETQDFDW